MKYVHPTFLPAKTEWPGPGFLMAQSPRFLSDDCAGSFLADWFRLSGAG